MQLMSPAMHNGLTTVLPASAIAKTQSVQKSTGLRGVYFGKQSLPAQGPGLFVTMDRSVPGIINTRYHSGGLGTLGTTAPYGGRIPFSLDDVDYAGIGLDIIQPLYQFLKEANEGLDNKWELIPGVETEIEYNGKVIPFRLTVRYEDVPGSDVPLRSFAVDSPLFDKLNRPFLADEEEVIAFEQVTSNKTIDEIKESMVNDPFGGGTYSGQIQSAKLMGLFTRAVAELWKKYEEKNPEEAGKYKFAVSNDWVTGFLPAFLDKNGVDGLANVYYMHNSADKQLLLEEVEALGLSRQELDEYNLVHQVPEKDADGELNGKTLQIVSTSEAGMAFSDSMIANKDFTNHLVSVIGKDQLYNDNLKAKFDAGLINHIHHVPEGSFNPFNNPALTKDGFQQMEGSFDDLSLENVKAFKTANRVALQKMLGLSEDPDAFVLGYWGSRKDLGQKGFELILRGMPEVLSKNPNVQVVITGIPQGSEAAQKKLQARLDEIRDAFPGRVSVELGNVRGDDRFQLIAGMDANMLPSTFEPMGLAQIEGSLMGTPMIATNIDGIIKTVLDPATDADNTDDKILQEFNQNYGQTGFKMAPIDYAKYMKIIGKVFQEKPLTGEENAYLDSETARYVDVIQRAVDMFNTDRDGFETIRLNGMRHINKEHSWPRINRYYGKAYNMAMDRKGITEKTYMPQAAFASGKRLSISG
jgi:glycogen synthase